MLKKRIRAICIACVLVCILPVVSHALDKDDFLKRLINISYPETNTETTQNNNESNKSNANENEDYIKFHIGEENIPTINTTEGTENNQSITNKVSSKSELYENDIRVTNENPRMLIYHTHSSETYSESPVGNYHSQDKANSVIAVGEELTQELTNKGWSVVHTTKYHDYPSFNESYSNSLNTLNELMPKYPSVDIAIDIHRDGVSITDESSKKQEEEKFTTTINGEQVATAFFVVGNKNENADEIRKLADEITTLANEMYPGLMLPVVEKQYGKYNQYVAPNHMLIEIGSNATSVEAAKASTKYIADVLDEYFK